MVWLCGAGIIYNLSRMNLVLVSRYVKFKRLARVSKNVLTHHPIKVMEVDNQSDRSKVSFDFVFSQEIYRIYKLRRLQLCTRIAEL